MDLSTKVNNLKTQLIAKGCIVEFVSDYGSNGKQYKVNGTYDGFFTVYETTGNIFPQGKNSNEIQQLINAL